MSASHQELIQCGALQLAEKVRAGDCSALELVSLYLERAQTLQGELACFHRLTADRAKEHAREIDAKRQRGETLGRLAGVPIGLKDNFITQGVETRCGSEILKGWVPPYKGFHDLRMRNEDAVMIGKCAMDEFAMGSSNENSPYEVVKNPWSFDHVPGGSSGGSAAAVAGGGCVLTLGSDTGGSIRQPASLCGIVGFKPSYGRVSRHGMVAFASSLDQAGPMTRNVRDAAAVFEILVGRDVHDATSSRDEVVNAVQACERPIKGLRIGVHRPSLEMQGMHPEVRRVFDSSLKKLEGEGAQIVEIELPHFQYAVATYYICCSAEASSNLARYDGIRYGQQVPRPSLRETYQATRDQGFGSEVKRRILIGTFVLRSDSYEEYYGRAMKVRTLIARDYERAFENCDLIASPTSPVPGFRIGERISDPLSMYLADVFTVGVNLARLPAISVPAGLSESKTESDEPSLPIGLQLIGPYGGDERVFQGAAGFEAIAGMEKLHPTIYDRAVGGEGQ